MDILVSDAHKGLKDAAFQIFQDGTMWQRCPFHFMKNVLDKCPASDEKELHGWLKVILEASSKERARQKLQECLEPFEEKAPKAMAILEDGFGDATAVLTLPNKYRRRLRTTNSLERLNQEVRRRETVLRIFPNAASAHRLVGALLLEQHEEWLTGRRYFDMTKYNEWKTKEEIGSQDPESQATAA